MNLQLDVALQIAGILARNPVFLDTETTGLGPTAEVVEVAVIDLEGNVLLDSLVKPTRSVPPDASRVHGITDQDVAGAPTFAEVWPRLVDVLQGKTVVVYNADYDVRLLHQSAVGCGMALAVCDYPWSSRFCMMNAYADYWGDWSEYHESYRWQQLGAACQQQKLRVPEGLHRARADAEATRRLACHLVAVQLAALAAADPERSGEVGC